MQQSVGITGRKARPYDLLRLAGLQFTGTVLFSLTLYYCFDLRTGLSAMFGGLVAVIASAFSAWQLYRGGGELQAEQMLVRFYVSVVIKIALSIALMAFFIIVIKVSTLPFIIAFLLAAVVINMLVLLLPEATA